MLKPIVELYNQVDKKNRKTLILAIIKYVNIFKVSWDHFNSDVPKNMYGVLMKRRSKAINLEEKMRNEAFKEIRSFISANDLETLKKICVE